MRCIHCGKFVTASAPKGASGIKYPRYSCIYCKTSVIGKKVSKSSDEVHKEFLELLSRIRYKENHLKVFKRIVLQRWCDEYDDALQTERAKVNRKFARDE